MEAVITFLKGDKIGSETDYRDAIPVNMYPISRPILGADGYMLQIEGLTSHGAASGIDRGGVWNERLEKHLRVSGSNLVEIDSAGTQTVLGAIAGTGQASLPYSFNTQGVVVGGNFYLYSPSGGFSQVTDPDIGNPIDGLWVDGYYFFTDGEFIYHTDIGNESAIDPLKYATAEFMPDPSLGLGKTQDNKVIVFGRYSTEYFINQANDNFAFSRVPTRAIKCGIVGTHAKCELNDRWYILGGRKEDTPSVYVMGVGEVQKVASREVDKIIASYTEIALQSVRMESRTAGANSYMIVHLPSHTLCYSETVAQKIGVEYAWTMLCTGVNGQPWRAINGVYDPRLGEWVYGDKIDSRLGLLDESVSTQYGDIAEWLLYTPLMKLEGMSVNELAIESMPGHTGNPDATAFMSLTYDGVTYGAEWTQLYGLPNDYGRRFIIRRLGYIRNMFAIKLRGASRSRMAFGRAAIDYG